MLILLVSVKGAELLSIAVVLYSGHWVGWSESESSFIGSYYHNNNVLCNVQPPSLKTWE